MAISERLKKLHEDRAAAWAKMNELRAEVGSGQATAEQRSTWDNIEAEIVGLGADITRQEGIERLEGAAQPPTTQRVDPIPVLKDDGVDEARYADIYSRFLRSGTGEHSRLTGEERQILQSRYESRAQGEGINSAGGYLVPSGYWVKMTETLKAFGGLMGLANIIHTASGNPLPWPSNNDTANMGALLAENVQVTEVDLTIAQQQLSAYTYTSNLVLVSLQLLQDAAFDLDTWLPKKLGQRLGRAIANDLVNGNGTAKPLGIINAPTAGATATVGGSTGVAWASNAYGKSYGDLITLIHSIDAAYRQMGNCKFLMNDLTLGVVRSITDSQNRPLWDPGRAGLGEVMPENIMGYPVVVDNAMPVMGVSAKSILFGDFEQGYVVRQVLDPTIMRLTERYADYLQVGFFGFLRIDGRPDDAAAVRSFVNSAT